MIVGLAKKVLKTIKLHLWSWDPFDAENERHYGFSPDICPVITTTNVVVLPSFNKWNCFSLRDHNMNTATSVSRSSGSDLPNGNRAHRTLTQREKLAKQRSLQRSEKDDSNAKEPSSLTKATSASNSPASYHRSTVGSRSNDIRNDTSFESPRRLTKATSLGGSPTPPTNHHRPAVRIQSNSSITEEKKVFGFKVMKGLPSSSSSSKNNSSGFNRHGSSGQPSRTSNNSTPNRFRDKTGNTLFYTPKTNRVPETINKHEKQAESKVGDSLKGKGDSSSSNTKIELLTGRSSEDVGTKLSDAVENDKDSSNTVSTTVMNIGVKGGRTIHLEKSAGVDEKSNNRREDTEMKADGTNGDDNHGNEVFTVSKEIEVKNEEGKTEKLLIRAESLREGKSRLEKLREKQKRGKLTRSLTNPDFQESENTAVNKEKDITQSLAEIRERIRERRRKKDQLKKSQSVPDFDSSSQKEVEEETKKFSGNSKDDLEKSGKVDMNKKETKHSREGKGSSLDESEYLQIKENSSTDTNVNMRKVDRKLDDDIAKQERNNELLEDGKSEKINKSEEKVRKTIDNEAVVVDTKKQDEFNKNDMGIPQGKKMELKEILSYKNVGTEKQTVDSTVANTKFGTDSNTITASNSEQNKSEVKKPTKRERRKAERYQRSKTMSAIMYNEISLEARREKEHKENDAKSGDYKDSESIAITPVSEMRKRFAETNGVESSKKSELGLFYSGKTPASAKSSGIIRLSSRSRTAKKASVKDDSAAETAKTSGTGSRRYVSRRHTLATGTTFQDQVTVDDDVKKTDADSAKINITDNEAVTADKNQTTKDNGKVSAGRRHTLPSYTTEISIQCKDAHSPVDHKKKEVSESGGRLPVRRHTFCSETSFTVNRINPVKFSESVGTLREKFSKGGAPVFNLATSSNVNSSKADNDVDRNGQPRQRIVSDSSVRRIIEEAKNSKDVHKESGSSLTRRHTIANADAKQRSKRDEDERQEFLDKFLAKDEEIDAVSKPKEGPDTKDIETEDDGQNAKHTKTGKEEKVSVSKLTNLFLGQPSNSDRKTKRRGQRAKTIAGGISEDIIKELAWNEHVVKPDLYVTDTTHEEAKEARPERRRRTSDLNPDNYLSLEPLLPKKTETNSVFSDEKSSRDDARPENMSNAPDAASVIRRSISDSDMKILGTASVTGEIASQDRGLVSSDVVDLRTPTETNPSVFDPTRTRSGSDVSGKDQCLDDYLSTAIKTLTDVPKPQRSSPRGSPQKGKLTASQSFDQNEEVHETKQHLDVVKTKLSMHSWSTSDLDKIFYGGNGTTSSASQVDVSTMDFDEISSSTTRLNSLTENRTKARPKRTSSKSLNPMKSLMERTDVRSHTEEPEEENKSTSGFEKAKKRSTPRKKRSQLEPWRRHTLDPVALAALAGREDFTRVSLRKTKGPGKEKDEYSGSLPVMLIQIKGRRQVQTRLVEPSLSSLNTGDCFLLVTPKELFCWIGQDANTIEKAKAVEISSKIQKRRDMDCKTGDVLYIDETKQGSSLAYRKFCKILEGETDFPIEDAKLCPDDEFYEREVISTNKVYKLQEGDPPHLMAITEMCGYMPRIGILNTKEVFVFDFGSELYVWTGQQSLSNKRKVAFHLAEMLYKQQFACEGVVSPIDPRRAMKRPQSSKPLYRNAEGKECGRPKWTLFAKLHEKAETLLFREKFFDWPDPTKIIKMKGHVSSGEIPERPAPVELKPCDPIEMQKPASDLEPAILEATNLGRGLGTPNVEINGEVKEGDMVTTLGMKVWLVTQNRHFVLPKSSEGHFHSGHGYVIRWVYFVAKNRIVRDRKGRVRPMTGRQRCAYFFWQGNECSVNEKGAAAIMAVELDEEHGPQIRVVEGKEPPHFLKLFDGAMTIHSGKRARAGEEIDDFSDKSTVRMYCIRNEDISEGCLVQVKKSASSLRSKSSFVVVDSEHGGVFVWHGSKTNEYHRASAEKAAHFIQERRPVEVNLSEETPVTVTTLEEGQESDLFWLTVGGKKNSYLSLLNDPLSYDFCPRLYHMTSATGQFTSTEILSPSRYPHRTCSFPVLQDDLYSASQPAAFLLDVGNEVYVWEGWMPSEITKDKRGSAKRRWDEERKLTLRTAMSYVEEVKERITKGAHVVQAGLEPRCFTTHFPFWNRRQDIADLQYKEGKKDYERKSVEDALDTFAKKFYSIQQLTSDSPPDGVDPSKLETYLNDEEFEKIFEMSRDLFGQLPGWKQDILKKAFGLF